MRYATTKIIPYRCGNIGIIEMNHPKALNAIDLEMVRVMHDILSHWQEDRTLKATLFKSSSSPSRSISSIHKNSTQEELSNPTGKKKSPPAFFCAGGDVKGLYEFQQKYMKNENQDQLGYGNPGLLTSDFFREEYQLNYKIATQKFMPQISLWDGIVMGGGVGISIHGKYRVATENTIFAMPETAIGFFPDVGSLYWIPHLLGFHQHHTIGNVSRSRSRFQGVGNYIALTGARLHASDLLYTGLATHFIPSSKLNDFINALIERSNNDEMPTHETNNNVAEDILSSFHEEPILSREESFLSKNRKEIDHAFGQKTSVEDIMSELRAMCNSSSATFAVTTLSTLNKMSPTSLKVTLEGLKRCSCVQNIEEVLQIEYRLAQAFIRRQGDFLEGVRAVLVDKDNHPKWNPSSLQEISDKDVETFFDSLGQYDLNLSPVPVS